MKINKEQQDYNKSFAAGRDSGRYDRVDFDWSGHSTELSDGRGRVHLLPWSEEQVLNYERMEDIIFQMKYSSWNTLAGYGAPQEAKATDLGDGAWVAPKHMSLSERDGDYK